MIGRTSIALIGIAALAISAHAQSTAHRAVDNDQSCVKQIHRDEADLPAATRQSRATLIANPGRIGAVAAEAAAAGERKRAEIELGILRAAEWLRCIDPYGYRALEDYISAHAGDPVIADLNKALNAEAAASGPATNGGASGNGAGGQVSGANPGPGFASFAAAAPVVSPSH